MAKYYLASDHDDPEYIWYTTDEKLLKGKGFENKETVEVKGDKVLVWANDESIMAQDWDEALEGLKTQWDRDYKENKGEYIESNETLMSTYEDEDEPLSSVEDYIKWYKDYIEDAELDKDSSYGALVFNVKTGEVEMGNLNCRDIKDMVTESKKVSKKGLKEKRKDRLDSKKGLLEKDVKDTVLKSFQEFFEGNENVALPKKLGYADTSLPIQINGKKPLKIAIKVTVNEEIGVYVLDGLTDKDKKLLPDSYFQGATLEDVEKDAWAFAKDVNKLVKESLKESKRNLKENSNTQDKVLVRVVIPNDYYDKYGNPVNAEKYDGRLEEIDKVLFEAGAETVWEVTSDPEAGMEGDDFNDTGFRRMTIAQLQVAIENGGIEEDEIRVYDNDIDIDRDYWTEYMNQHPEIDPWDYASDFDIYEDHRIYDIYSLVFDADNDENSLSEGKKKVGQKFRESYSPDLLRELVNEYAYESDLGKVWDEVYNMYHDEELANDVVEGLETDEEDYDDEFYEAKNKKSNLKESFDNPIDSIVIPYNGEHPQECAQELKNNGFTAEEVKAHFDDGGYYNPETDETIGLGTWDKNFADDIINYLRTTATPLGPTRVQYTARSKGWDFGQHSIDDEDDILLDDDDIYKAFIDLGFSDELEDCFSYFKEGYRDYVKHFLEIV